VICDSLQMKTKFMTTVQYFAVVLFIMLYMGVLDFVSVDEVLKYDHSNESY